VLGANLGAFRRAAPQTLMDARGHVHGDDRVCPAARAHLIRQRSVVQVHLGAPHRMPLPPGATRFCRVLASEALTLIKGRTGLTAAHLGAVEWRSRELQLARRAAHRAGLRPRPSRPRTARCTGLDGSEEDVARMSRTGLAAPSQGRMRPPWPYNTKESHHDDPADGQRPYRCRRP
jgi:hypothetical protein